MIDDFGVMNQACNHFRKLPDRPCFHLGAAGRKKKNKTRKQKNSGGEEGGKKREQERFLGRLNSIGQSVQRGPRRPLEKKSQDKFKEADLQEGEEAGVCGL